MSETLLPCIPDLREWFYQDDDGTVRWAKRASQRVKAGAVVGHYTSKGYRQVKWRGGNFSVHRIAFALAHGRWPSGQIDHINGKKDDNSACNLREVTNQQNSFNRPSRNVSTGLKGATLHRGRFIARCSRDGKVHHLGCFDTAAEAHAAYVAAASALHGDYASFSTVAETRT